jgi:hypothetical protein
MNRLILTPLMILMFCASLTQALKISDLNQMNYNSNSYNVSSVTGTQIINGSSQSYNVAGQTVPTFELIGVDGVLALMIGLIAIGAIAGISILGSGLSNSAQNIIYKSVFYYALWGIFSVLAFSGISSIPFGTLIYLAFTIFYAVGVQEQINTHSSE